MCGVESTRAPSMPRKLMAFSLVTRMRDSPFVPTEISAIWLCRRQAREHTAHVAERALHARHRVVAVDFVLQVDAALVVHLLQLLEDLRERHDAVTHIALAGLGLAT